MSLPYTGSYVQLLSLCCGLLLLLGLAEAYEKISDKTLRALPRPHDDFDIHNGALLSPILRVRVPGTPNSTAVLNHFTTFFQSELPEWNIQFQRSTSKTPVSDDKDVPFVNFIASRDPPWASVGDVERVTFVAHYDSKLEPKGFIGAIDSAAPCAIIMHAMRSIDAALEKKWDAVRAHGKASLEEQRGIQVMFLDGEEAFGEWSDTDSLYGARSLAEQWDNEVNPAMSEFKTPLSSISLFVLLDLLGAKAPLIQSYYQTTHWAYQHLAELEKRFRSLHQFKSSSNPWFIDASKNENNLSTFGGIQDDHLPFLARGVEVLHVIDFSLSRDYGFPDVWHTIKDDGEHLDLETVEDWSMLITAFAAEWMELEGYFDSAHGGKARRSEDHAEQEAIRWNRKTEL